MDKNGGWRRGKAAFLNQLWQCTWKDAAITFGVLFIATAAAFVYYRISASNINVVMFYTLALLFISRLTSGYPICKTRKSWIRKKKGRWSAISARMPTGC